MSPISVKTPISVVATIQMSQLDRLGDGMTLFRFGDFAVSSASKSMRFVISAEDSEEEGTRGDMLRRATVTQPRRARARLSPAAVAT